MAAKPPLLVPSDSGPYCAAGDFYIDPWRAVDRAVITHAHSDHARRGARWYLCEASGALILQARMGEGAKIETLRYGESTTLGGVKLSFHPAGHILGSAQVRLEHGGEVWVFSGDCNPTHASPACVPFASVRAHTYIIESTFGLPIYRWLEPATVFAEIHAWWRRNREAGRTTILPAYPLGKSQRVLAGLDPSVGPIAIHGNAWSYLPHYRAAGVPLPPTLHLEEATLGEVRGRGLVITSVGSGDGGLLTRLGETSLGYASGWMMTRAARRSRSFDRGFVLSDHGDWPGLLQAVEASGAERVGVTHGQVEAFSRYLRERGKDAYVFPTHYEGEGGGEEASMAATPSPPIDAAETTPQLSS